MSEPYDERKDTIIMSEDFENCEHKDKDDQCLLAENNPKCWHVWECPDGKERI